jgi:hypothetical protein
MAYFCDLIIAKLVRAVYLRGIVTRRRIFSSHLDNAETQNSARATEFIDGKPVIRLRHSPYSAYVTPSNFSVVGMFPGKLKNRSTRTLDELKQEMYSILKSIPKAELIPAFQT